MSALFAFLHHLAAFAVVATLAIELVLLRLTLDAPVVRKLQRVDLVYGISAAAVLAIGFIRVLWLEKGSGYYFHNAFFNAKLAAFAAVGIASIWPTLRFIAWARRLKANPAAVVSAAEARPMRALVHAELGGLAVILLAAALMARGYGSFA